MNEDLIRKELKFVAALSRGPGGQNVNRTASAAQLYWDFRSSLALSEDEKTVLENKLVNLINKEGLIFLRSDENREFLRNREKCVEKLMRHIQRALHKPMPRKATKPTRASRERRHQTKRRRSEIKKSRARID